MTKPSKRSFIAKAFFLATVLTSISVPFASSTASAVNLKYPQDVKPLSLDNSFLRRSTAPDYWKLNGFLVKQNTNSACSLASMTIILNAARGSDTLDQGERLLTQTTVLKTTDRNDWMTATATDGGGVSLRELESIATSALTKHGYASATIKRVPVEQDQSQLQQFREDLRENERDSRSYMVVNFDQSFVMNEEGVAGHFASVGAYDSTTDRVLILDPDKDWYEPYWVPTRKLFEAMAKTRGYLKIRF